MNWQIRIASSVIKNLKRFPAKDITNIKSALDELVFNPYHGDVQKIEGRENSWRRRIGAYRIFFDIDKKRRVINITHIKRRTSSTY